MKGMGGMGGMKTGGLDDYGPNAQVLRGAAEQPPSRADRVLAQLDAMDEDEVREVMRACEERLRSGADGRGSAPATEEPRGPGPGPGAGGMRGMMG